METKKVNSPKKWTFQNILLDGNGTVFEFYLKYCSFYYFSLILQFISIFPRKQMCGLDLTI